MAPIFPFLKMAKSAAAENGQTEEKSAPEVAKVNNDASELQSKSAAEQEAEIAALKAKVAEQAATIEALSEAPTQVAEANLVEMNGNQYRVVSGAHLPNDREFEFGGKKYSVKAGAYKTSEIVSNSAVLAFLLSNKSNTVEAV